MDKKRGLKMFKVNGLVAFSLIGLTACGGGSGGGGNRPVIADGVFKDSNVSGLTYESGSQNGVTNTLGAFRYEEGSQVSFNIGGVSLGSGLGQAVMTPLNLVENGLLATPEVINRARFLLMLDSDNESNNGIEISREVQEIADDWEQVDFAGADFPNQALNAIIVDASVADDISHSLPDVDTATAHLRSTLLCASAGAFEGTYTGTEGGNIVLVLDPVTGQVNGSSFNPANEVSVEINNTQAIDSDVGLSFVSTEDSAKEFTGILQTSNEVDGTWINISDDAMSGAFSATRFGSQSDTIERYIASFTGDDKGAFTFNVSTNNTLSGVVYNVSTGEENSLSGRINDDNNQLTAISDAGDEITGFIDPVTLAFTSGVWINGQQQSSGNFAGGGCRLN